MPSFCAADVLNTTAANCSCLPGLTFAQTYEPIDNCVESVYSETVIAAAEVAIFGNAFLALLAGLFALGPRTFFSLLAGANARPSFAEALSTFRRSAAAALLAALVLALGVAEKGLVLGLGHSNPAVKALVLAGFLVQVLSTAPFAVLLAPDNGGGAAVRMVLWLLGLSTLALLILASVNSLLFPTSALLFYLGGAGFVLTLVLLTAMRGGKGAPQELNAQAFLALRLVVLGVLFVATAIGAQSNYKSVAVANLSWFAATILFVQLVSSWALEGCHASAAKLGVKN